MYLVKTKSTALYRLFLGWPLYSSKAFSKGRILLVYTILGYHYNVLPFPFLTIFQ